MLLALGLIQRYVAPTARSSGGAIGVGGAVNEKGARWKIKHFFMLFNLSTTEQEQGFVLFFT